MEGAQSHLGERSVRALAQFHVEGVNPATMREARLVDIEFDFGPVRGCSHVAAGVVFGGKRFQALAHVIEAIAQVGHIALDGPIHSDPPASGGLVNAV